MKVKKFIESARLDWSELYFSPDGGSAYFSPFAMSPEVFLTFAKADFFNTDTKGLINALSNAKRAIDCQVDGFLVAIGFDPDKLDKQLGKEGVAHLPANQPGSNGPLKFRLLQALGFATPAIVSRIRRLRNLLEHEYKKPRRKEVSDAIDVAELFVHACRGKMRNPMTSFGFGSSICQDRGQPLVVRSIYFSFKEEPSPAFELTFWDQKLIAREGTGKSPEIRVTLGEPDFVPLLKLMWQADWNRDMSEPFKAFLCDLELPFPSSRFHLEERAY
jgi:hypothetical protein